MSSLVKHFLKQNLLRRSFGSLGSGLSELKASHVASSLFGTDYEKCLTKTMIVFLRSNSAFDEYYLIPLFETILILL